MGEQGAPARYLERIEQGVTVVTLLFAIEMGAKLCDLGWAGYWSEGERRLTRSLEMTGRSIRCFMLLKALCSGDAFTPPPYPLTPQCPLPPPTPDRLERPRRVPRDRSTNGARAQLSLRTYLPPSPILLARTPAAEGPACAAADEVLERFVQGEDRSAVGNLSSPSLLSLCLCPRSLSARARLPLTHAHSRPHPSCRW